MTLEVSELEHKIEPYRDGAARILTTDDYTSAVQKRAGARALIDELNQTFDPLIKAARESLDKIRALKAKFEKPLNDCIQAIDSGMERFEKLAQATRSEQEAAMALTLTAEAEQAKAKEVKSLAAMGYIRESRKLAEALVEAPMVPVMPSPVPKVEGLSKRTDWSAEVTDFKALVQAVASGSAPLEALSPNMTCLNALARAAKGTMSIPGVKAVSKPIRVQRRA